MGVSTLFSFRGRGNQQTDNQFLSASLRLCWSSFTILVVHHHTKRHRVIHPSCVVTVHQLHRFFSSAATSSIYHCSSSAMQQHLSIHSFITDVPIHQLYLPISSSIASRSIHEVELAYNCLTSVGASSSEGSSVLESCSIPPCFSCKRHLALTSRPHCFLHKTPYFLQATALIIIYSSSTSSIHCLLSVILALKNEICKCCRRLCY